MTEQQLDAKLRHIASKVVTAMQSQGLQPEDLNDLMSAIDNEITNRCVIHRQWLSDVQEAAEANAHLFKRLGEDR